MSAARASVPLLAIFGIFFRIGLFSFGGGVSGWIYREVVTLRGWMSDADFLSGLALGQILPGANVTNLTVYIGQHLRGFSGAVCALVGLLTGPFFAVIGLAMAYDRVVGVPLIQDALSGAAAAAIGLLLVLALRGAYEARRRLAPMLILLSTFVAVGILQWPLVAVVLCLAPVSVLLAWIRAWPDA
jgi:chromate transporter